MAGFMASAALCARPATAAFSAQLEPPPARPSFAALGTAPVTQVGAGTAGAVPGFGHQVPLAEAIRMLLPAAWRYAPGDDLGALAVSWTGTNTWLDALHQIGEAYRLRFLVDWTHQVLYVEPVEAGASTAAAGTRAPGSAAPAMQAPIWELQAGGLREQLSRWAERAHYHLYWPQSIADIWVQVPAALGGDFLEAVKQLSTALQAVGTGVKLHVYPQNQALVIQEY